LQYHEFVLFGDRLAAIAKSIAYEEERTIPRRAGAKADASISRHAIQEIVAQRHLGPDGQARDFAKNSAA
jgi:hypothetical protein